MATVKTRLMTALQNRFPQNEFRYTDIIRTLKEDVKGESYDPTRDRGYYATNLCKNNRGYLRYPSSRENRHLVKSRDGLWSVNGSLGNYPIVDFYKNDDILKGRLLSRDSQGNARIQLLSGGAPLFVRFSDFSENPETFTKLTKERIEKEHGHSYREYIRLMKLIGEKI